MKKPWLPLVLTMIFSTFNAYSQHENCEEFQIEIFDSSFSCNESEDTGVITVRNRGTQQIAKYQWSTGDTTRRVEGLLPGLYYGTFTSDEGLCKS